MTAALSVCLTVNGEGRTAAIEHADDMLVDYLRDELQLVDVKIGCREGACGACTVLINGAATTSCLVYLARTGGSDVRTASHLVGDTLGQRIGAAFVRHRTMQCGYCTPGFLVCAVGYLNNTPANTTLDRDELAESFRGHLCRCTGYVRILDAVSEVARGGDEGVDAQD